MPFGDVPADAQVPSHVEDRHRSREFQGVALEGPGVGPPRIGDFKFHLADHPTRLTGDARDGQDDNWGTAANRKRLKSSLHTPARLNVARPTRFATERLGGLLNREHHAAALV